MFLCVWRLSNLLKREDFMFPVESEQPGKKNRYAIKKWVIHFIGLSREEKRDQVYQRSPEVLLISLHMPHFPRPRDASLSMLTCRFIYRLPFRSHSLSPSEDFHIPVAIENKAPFKKTFSKNKNTFSYMFIFWFWPGSYLLLYLMITSVLSQFSLWPKYLSFNWGKYGNLVKPIAGR